MRLVPVIGRQKYKEVVFYILLFIRYIIFSFSYIFLSKIILIKLFSISVQNSPFDHEWRNRQKKNIRLNITVCNKKPQILQSKKQK